MRPRLSMRNVREILRQYWGLNLSINKIHQSCGISRSTVDDYIRRAKAANLSWPLPDELDDDSLERMLFPSASPAVVKERPLPNWSEVHEKLRRKGETLSRIWLIYKQDNQDGYEFSRFFELYRQWRKAADVVMRQRHRAGEKVFSDFAGDTVPIVDSRTGEVIQTHIFVSTLGASNFTYCEAFWNEKKISWCMGQAHAFAYFGGVPEVVVPDNPKTVVSKPCRFEPEINPEFNHMASHFGCVVIPARVRHPRDKAAVESAVNVVTMWILAHLKDRTFFSLTELNKAIRELLEDLNTRPFQKLPGCRRSQFELIDKPALKPLPPAPYEYTEMHECKVHIDYHVEYDGHWYSVPYQLVKKRIELRATARTIEILSKGKRVASHMRSFERGRHTTVPEHMPKAHQQYLQWTPERIINWASKTGTNTTEFVRQIMNAKAHPEQGFRACLGIMRLGRIHGNDRLEAACQRGLAIGANSYRSIESILKNGLDKQKLESKEQVQQLKITHSNLRGSEYYQEEKDANTPNSEQFKSTEVIWNGESNGSSTIDARCSESEL